MGRFGSGMLENDLDDDVARVPASVDGLLHHLEKLLEDHELLGVAGPL